MRRLLPALLAGISFLLVAPVGLSGYPPQPEPENYCPPITLVAGEPGQGLYVADQAQWPGAFALALPADILGAVTYVMNYGIATDLGGFYFTQLYQESNGIPGLQRADPTCVDEGGWDGADSWMW